MSTFTQRARDSHNEGLKAFQEFLQTGILPKPPAQVSPPEVYWPWYDGFLEGFQTLIPPDCEDGIVVYDRLMALMTKARATY